MAENEHRDDLRAMTLEQRAEWLARTIVDLADRARLYDLDLAAVSSELERAAEVVHASGWQPGAFATQSVDDQSVDDEHRPSMDLRAWNEEHGALVSRYRELEQGADYLVGRTVRAIEDALRLRADWAALRASSRRALDATRERMKQAKRGRHA